MHVNVNVHVHVHGNTDRPCSNMLKSPNFRCRDKHHSEGLYREEGLCSSADGEVIMNFFEQQEQSKQKTLQLFFLFILADSGVFLAVYFVIIFVMNYYVNEGATAMSPAAWADPLVLIWVFVLTQTIILGGSFVKIMALRRGGQYVAESLGGRLINHSTNDTLEKRLVNVVEEMAIASGISVPMVYVLDNEDGINAFAAGFSPDDAVVAVTKGCLQHLTRDELQGVVGHEFSHILNGDMRLNIRLIGFISGIMILATIGYYILRSGGRSRKGSGPVMLMGISLIIIGYVGVFFARLIQSAVSRQREYLADASSVQFTRNPSGLANALKKIGGFSKGSVLKAPLASEASHMFFGSAVKSIFATHPPLADRIRRIDPSFAGDFSAPDEADTTVAYDEAVTAFSGLASSMPQDAKSVVSQVGTVSPDHVDFSAKLLEAIPAQIRKELADPLGASSVVFALLLDEDLNQKKRQIENLNKTASDAIIRHILIIDKALSGLDPKMKLSLVDLAMPSLRRMSKAQFDEFQKYSRILIESDERLSLFEFAVQQIITYRLDAAFTKAAKKQVYKSIEPLVNDILVLISKLAYVGHADKNNARKAFESAVKKLSAYGATAGSLIGQDPPFDDVGRAISRIAASKPGIKETVLEACAQCVLFDRIVSIEEAELLRAIAYCLDLPLAPFLGTAV